MPTGSYWNVSDPLKPWGLLDPDEELDIPWDFAAWLANEGTTYGSHTFTPDPNLRVIASSQAGGVIKGRVAKAIAGTLVTGTKYGITCHLVDSAGQKKDQTLWFKIKDL